MKINVQFSDSSESEICAYYGGPQNASVTNQGTADTSSTIWSNFYKMMDGFGMAGGLPLPDASSS